MTSSAWFGCAVALGIGLLIGLERERSKGSGAGRRAAGIRTFALLALLGAVAGHLGERLLALVMLGVIVLAGLSYWRDRSGDPGLTTEAGLLITPLLGALAMVNTSLAAALGTAVAVLFAAKVPLHGFVTRILTAAEVTDGLIFAVATLIVWPQLPDRYIGPFAALNLHSLWYLVILMMTIGACGHAAARAMGTRFGLPLTGLASGFVSSTATIGTMAALAKRTPVSMNAAVAGAVFSTVGTFIQLSVLLAALSRATLLLLAPALAAGAVVAALYALAFALRGRHEAEAVEPGRAFSLGTALGLAALIAVMLLGSAALRAWAGEAGVMAGALVAGFADAHSPAISIASLVAGGKMAPSEAVLPILVAVTTNTASKLAMARGVGSQGFLLRIAPGVVAPVAAAWVAALALG
ncbi:MAG: MgtC/SapB family protein [Rhodospirillales bacterium]|nr:MgtC/SapB family protein [Rhodospirillales bacterium]